MFSLSVRFAYSVFNELRINPHFVRIYSRSFLRKLPEDSSSQDHPLFTVSLLIPLFHILQFSRQRKLPVLASASAKTTQWWAQVDSNHRPPAYQASALTSWAMSPCLRSFVLSRTSWWRWRESNPWPPACKAGALPSELHPHYQGAQWSLWSLKIKQQLLDRQHHSLLKA